VGHSASELALDVVATYVEKNVGIALDTQDEPIAMGDPANPKTAVAFGFLCVKGRVTPVLQK
jgi:hypothetical protein